MSTCRLKAHAQCSSGSCCEKCQLKARGTICRAAKDAQCDLAESCDGISSQCPSDEFYHDGSECDGKGSLCYSGKCVSSLKQCQNTWGSDAVNSDMACYVNFNTIGFVNGNCGRNSSGFVACEKHDSECGLLNCAAGAEEPLKGLQSFFKATTGVKGRVFECKMVTDDNGVYVDDGTPCGVDGMCVERKCVARPVGRCSVGANGLICSGNGVCSSGLRCVCGEGWVGSACESFVDSAVPKLGVGKAPVSSVVLFGAIGVVVLLMLCVFAFMVFCTKRRRKVFDEEKKTGCGIGGGLVRAPSVRSSVSASSNALSDNISVSKLNNAIRKLSEQPTKSILKKGVSEANFSVYGCSSSGVGGGQEQNYEEIDNTQFNTHLNRKRFSVASKSVSSDSASSLSEYDDEEKIDIEEQAVPSPCDPFKSEFLKVQGYLNELKMLTSQNGFLKGEGELGDVGEDLITPTKPAVMLLDANLYGSDTSSGYISTTASDSNRIPVEGTLMGKENDKMGVGAEKEYSINLENSVATLDKRYSYLIATASTNSLNKLP